MLRPVWASSFVIATSGLPGKFASWIKVCLVYARKVLAMELVRSSVMIQLVAVRFFSFFSFFFSFFIYFLHFLYFTYFHGGRVF